LIVEFEFPIADPHDRHFRPEALKS